MDTVRKCGCKGRRSCSWCEEHLNITPDFTINSLQRNKAYVYCLKCEKAWPGWSVDTIKAHPNHSGSPISFPGILIVENFLTDEETVELIKGIDNDTWEISQSGRRKQNYGPKCNFKKRKLSLGNFTGFPKFSIFVQEKLLNVPKLSNFIVIEQCSLEYDPTRGASIDPHIDDCWIWGERVVTVNVIGDSVLTLKPYIDYKNRYNLDLINDFKRPECDPNVLVRIPMPAKSLIVLYGEARYVWEHFVLREDIQKRRVCLAYREFTMPYLKGGKNEEKGSEIVNLSLSCLK